MLLCRANRDKESLEQKLRQSSRASQPAAAPADKQRSAPSQHNLEELRRKNYQLEEEVTRFFVSCMKSPGNESST